MSFANCDDDGTTPSHHQINISGSRWADAPWLSLAQLSARCARQLRGLLARCVERCGLSDGEFLLLWLCSTASEQGVAQRELAEGVAASPAQASGLVERLRQRGLIAASRRTGDRRKNYWRLTPEGERLLAEAMVHVAPQSSRLEARLTFDQQRLLGKLLENLAQCGRGTSPRAGGETASGQSAHGSNRVGETASGQSAHGSNALGETAGEQSTHGSNALGESAGGETTVGEAAGTHNAISGSTGRMARAAVLLFCVVGLMASGCSRAFYRRQADVDAYTLIEEKANHPHWDLPDYSIDVDPASRMFDPFNPDCPPMPMDDPAAHEYMHRIDGKRAWPRWHANGETPFVDNPLWRACLTTDEDGAVVLDQNAAVRLALLNSTDYQSQLETLYLSALDVSSERFQFDTQYFGGYAADYTTTGPDRPGGPTSSLALSLFSSRGNSINMHRLFASGAELAVGLANSLIWQYSGTDTHTALTIVDFTLLQPLLRQAGRDRVLETLTIAERALLYNVRAMERYRRGFYLTIVTGGGGSISGPSRRGGVFGASGLGGFTGVGGGGFGRVGGGAGGAGGAGAGAGQAGGFIGLLQVQQNIRNQEANITGLRINLTQLRESLKESLTRIPDTPDEVLRERLQISQARQALYNAQSRLLNSQADYQSDLDAFKVRLGLPPDICLKIKDPILDQFNIIDDQIVPRQSEITKLRDEVGLINEAILAGVVVTEVDGRQQATLAWSDELDENLRRLRSISQRIDDLLQLLLEENLARAGQDIDNLERQLPKRRQALTQLRSKYLDELESNRQYKLDIECQNRLPADVDPAVFDTTRLENLVPQLRGERERVAETLGSYGEPLEALKAYLDAILAAQEKPEPRQLYDDLESMVIFAIPGLLSRLETDVLDMSLLQARARTDSVLLPVVDLTPPTALEIARRYRRDWMNARGALVDAWRLIEFNADNLEGSLDLVVSGDIRNTGDNPIRLQSTAGQLRLGFQFDAPITRLQERNTYRQSLIEYQDAKRSYYRFVDQILQGLRGTLRTLDVNSLNFEQQRIAVLGAIEQIVLNDEIQTINEQRGQTSGVTAARDVVSALADLQDAQNNFLSVWVNYEVVRRGLDLDLGTMQLDSEGLWIDPGPIGPDYGKLPDGSYPECPGELHWFEILDAAGGVRMRVQGDESTEMLPDGEVSPDGKVSPDAETLPEGTDGAEAQPEAGAAPRRRNGVFRAPPGHLPDDDVPYDPAVRGPEIRPADSEERSDGPVLLQRGLRGSPQGASLPLPPPPLPGIR